LQFSTRSLKEIGESAANFVFREGSVERSAETIRDDPDGEYLKRNRWFESGSLQQRVGNEISLLHRCGAPYR